MVKDLPLILHTRDKQGREEVYRDTVRILKEEAAGDRRLRGIFHCFGGPAWLADEAIELGFLLGIGGTLTFKNSGVAALVKEIPWSTSSWRPTPRSWRRSRTGGSATSRRTPGWWPRGLLR